MIPASENDPPDPGTQQKRSVKGFANHLLRELEEILKSKSSSDINRLDRNITELSAISERLYTRWKSELPVELHPMPSTFYSKKLITTDKSDIIKFIGPSGNYLIPGIFWSTANPLKFNVKKYKEWLLTQKNELSWEKYQNRLYQILWEGGIVNYGLTAMHVEIIRFHTRFFLNYPYREDDNPENRRHLLSNYIPKYVSTLTFNQLNKNYNNLLNFHADDDSIPKLSKWNLDIICIDPNTQVDLQEEYPLMPIWKFTGLKNDGQSKREFVIHVVPRQVLSRNEKLHSIKVKNITLFWNLNHYSFQLQNNKKSRGKLKISSPWTIYSLFEDQNFTLIDSVKDNDENHTLESKNHLNSPEWQLDLVSENNIGNTTINVTEHKLLSQKTINLYNTRFIDPDGRFYEQYYSKKEKYDIDKLFYRRLYLVKLPTSIRGIMWLSYQSQISEYHIKRLKLFLTAWLHRGPIIEYPTGMIVYTYFSESIVTNQNQENIREFFKTLDIDVEIYTNSTLLDSSQISIYSLPGSWNYNEKSKEWTLPETRLMPSVTEIHNDLKGVHIEELNIRNRYK